MPQLPQRHNMQPMSRILERSIRMNGILSTIGLMCLAAILSANADNDAGLRLVQAARAQVGKTVQYDPSYQPLKYPNGDIPLDRGVCADVVVRACRTGLGLDLQKLVHEDMQGNFQFYPQNWGLKRPDKNIDHRRVPNLQTYFKRMGWSVEVSTKAEDYKPGDVVTCMVPPRLPHIMIVSERVNAEKRPLVIHNIGAGANEEDRLFEFTITGHYRITKIQPAGPANTTSPRR